MKKVLVIISKGFEEVELLGPLDMFSRSDISYDLTTIDNTSDVVSSHNFALHNVKPLTENINVDMYDMLYIPGGAHFKTLDNSTLVKNTILKFDKASKLIGSICAAPILLGHLGLLKNKNYTCFTAMNEDMGGNYKYQGVVADGRYITGRSVYYSTMFGIELAKHLLSKTDFERLCAQIHVE